MVNKTETIKLPVNLFKKRDHTINKRETDSIKPVVTLLRKFEEGREAIEKRITAIVRAREEAEERKEMM